MHSAREAGQTLPLVGLVLGVLLGFAGLAVDVGYLRYEQRHQQTAADSAAIAGEFAHLAGSDVAAAAKRDAANNGYTDNGTTVVVTANTPPTAGVYTSTTGAVEATVTVQYPLFFMRVLGYANNQVQTRAVALPSGKTQNCIYVLNSSANFNKSGVEAPSCGMILNGGANFTGATVDAGSIACGTGSTCSNGTFTGATPAPAIPAPDPCMQIPGCAYLTNNPPNTTPCVAPVNNNPGHLSPGCYPNGINVANQNITMDPGLYVIKGGTFDAHGNGASNTTTISGANVTVYVTGSASLNFHGANVNLEAPTSGDYSSNFQHGEQNVLFWSNSTGGVNFQTALCTGCTQNLSGTLYFPNQTVNYNKTTTNADGSYALLIFGGVNLNKSDSVFDGPGAGGTSFLLRPVLAE